MSKDIKKKPRLVISAAHTSSAPGSVYKDLREFDLTRKILEKTIPLLEKEKIEHKAVPVDLPLLQRIDWINDTGYKEEDGDIFLEIHINDGGKKGIECWYSGDDDKDNNSKKFADVFIDEFCKLTKYEKIGSKSEYTHQMGSLLILNQTNPIAIAVEFLHIDNPEEYKILKDDKKLDDIAKNIVLALKKYIDNPPKLSEVKKKKDSDPFSFGGPPMGVFGGGSSAFGSATFGPDPLGVSDSEISSSSSGSGVTMDRQQRTEMIKKNFEKLLGKEPKQADLNYYLNIGVTEEQLIQRIMKSKDHEELVKNAKEAEDMRKKITTYESELTKLRAETNDLKAMLDNLNKLLQAKNQQIAAMHNELRIRGIILKGEYYDPNRVQRPIK
ncbi:MAG: hypothetical protein Kow0081_0610 [Candidatus Dojkabacteria bacterium]